MEKEDTGRSKVIIVVVIIIIITLAITMLRSYISIKEQRRRDRAIMMLWLRE